MTLTAVEYQFVLKHDFMSFIERAFYELNAQTPFLPASHIEVIASKLEACRLGKIRRLVINVPPRHLKSHCASIAFPAWLLGHDPAAQVICASYGQELADKFARDTRLIMLSAWYRRLFLTRLADRQAVYDFVTTQQGTRMATSIGGVLTGRGANFIIIDDPIKPEDALSEPRRSGANEWYDHTLLSRLNDKATGCIIIIMQRLHQDDLVGHVLAQGGWDVVSFPAIADRDEVHVIDTIFGCSAFRRNVGEVLHPERETLATLQAIRQSMGEYHFSCQYQQNPMPLGGAMIKLDWLKSYPVGNEPGHFDEVVQSWDTANKASELSDFSVCSTWGIKDDFFFLLHVFRERLGYPDLRRKVKELATRFHADAVVIEDKASGTQLIQDLKNDGLFCVEPYQPRAGADKIMRLHAQTAVFESGRVLLPDRATWLGDYVSELTGFPGTRYDDQVDSTAQALDYMNKSSTLRTWRKLGRMGPFEGLDAIGRY